MKEEKKADWKLVSGIMMLIMSFTFFGSFIFLRLLFLVLGLKYLYEYMTANKARQTQHKRTTHGDVRPRHREDYRDRLAREKDMERKSQMRHNRGLIIQQGKDAFDNYDYKKAQSIFEKGLQEFPEDPVFYFNLACCCSLLEKKEEALEHLKKAVEFGFDEIEKIETHDALAFLRIQPEFEEFKEQGYQIQSENGSILENADLLDKLERLKDLRDRGILNDAEFIEQKEKLLNKL